MGNAKNMTVPRMALENDDSINVYQQSHCLYCECISYKKFFGDAVYWIIGKVLGRDDKVLANAKG